MYFTRSSVKSSFSVIVIYASVLFLLSILPYGVDKKIGTMCEVYFFALPFRIIHLAGHVFYCGRVL